MMDGMEIFLDSFIENSRNIEITSQQVYAIPSGTLYRN